MKRFRAYLTYVPTVGTRMLVPAAMIREEWDLSTGGGRSFVPRRIDAFRDRPGIVKRVVERPDHFDPEAPVVVDVTFEDVPPRYASNGTILTALGRRQLCTTEELFALLDHLAGRRLVTDPQRVHVAGVCRDWLTECAPRVAGLWRHHPVPEYDTTAEYLALMDGVAEVLGSDGTTVGAPPFAIDLPPDPEIPMSPPLTVRGDVFTQIAKHRSN